MVVKFMKNFLFGKKKKHEGLKVEEELQASRLSTAENPATTRNGAPRWQYVLTQSLTENALAPSEEVILHAFDLYCDALNAPFLERRRAMNERFSNVVTNFAELQAMAPDMVERAAAKHRLELNRFIVKKDDI